MKALVFIFGLLVVSTVPAFAQESVAVVSTDIGVYASFATVKVNGTSYFVTEGDTLPGGLKVVHIGLNSVRFSDDSIIYVPTYVAKR